MVTALHGLALACYIVAAAVLAGSLAGGRRSAPRLGLLAAGAGLLWHGLALGVYLSRHGELPLVGLAPSLSTLAFLTGLLAVGTAMTQEARPLGLVLVPFVAVLLALALALGLGPAGEPLTFRGPWFILHVVLAFLGYAGLAVSFAAGLLYLLQFRELKGKRFGRMFRFFPPLESLDRLGRRALALGFAALSLSLVVGWAWTVRFDDLLRASEPKVAWAVFTWLVFVAALLARLGGPGRDRRGAWASVVGFVLVVLSYVAFKLAVTHGGFFL